MNFIHKIIEPKSKKEDLKRKEYILNVLLLGSIFLAIFVNLYVTIFGLLILRSSNMINPLVPFIILFIFIGLLALSKKGYSILASNFLIIFYLLPCIFAIYAWGIDLPQALLTMVLVIVMSGVLISTRFAFSITGLIALMLTFFAYAQNNGITYPDLTWKEKPLGIGDAITASITFGVIVIVSWLSNREIERSLKRAHRSEAELKKERDSLEIKVEERTRELKRIQLEKMQQMAHFAEFGQIASGVFHDLLNPLTAISLNLHQATTIKPGKINEAKPYIEQALKATKKAEEFALTINKQIKQQEIFEKFNPLKEINQVIELIGYKIKKDNIKIELKSSQENVNIYGNPLKFHRTIMNLIMNSIDSYTGTQKETKLVMISLEKTKDNLTIDVIDYGKGIDNKLLPRIFDPFMTTKKISSGTGIGLSVVKNTIEKEFGGEILVSSKENQGTTFRLILPTIK